MASKESEPLAAASEVASATGGEGASATGGEGASATGSETKPDKPTPGPVASKDGPSASQGQEKASKDVQSTPRSKVTASKDPRRTLLRKAKDTASQDVPSTPQVQAKEKTTITIRVQREPPGFATKFGILLDDKKNIIRSDSYRCLLDNCWEDYKASYRSTHYKKKHPSNTDPDCQCETFDIEVERLGTKPPHNMFGRIVTDMGVQKKKNPLCLNPNCWKRITEANIYDHYNGHVSPEEKQSKPAQGTPQSQGKLSISGYTLLELFLKDHQCERKWIPGYGNCLFKALSFQLTGTTAYHSQLREEIADFESKEKSVLEVHYTPQNEKTFDDHIKEIRRDRVWGTDLEIYATATYFQLHIRVAMEISGTVDWNTYSPCNNKAVSSTGIPVLEKKRMDIIYVNNNHFDAVISDLDGLDDMAIIYWIFHLEYPEEDSAAPYKEEETQILESVSMCIKEEHKKKYKQIKSSRKWFYEGYINELALVLHEIMPLTELEELEDYEISALKNAPLLEKKKEDPKKYYNYLLLDWRKDTDTSFQEFVKAIFYVGKGTGKRTEDHFKDARMYVVGQPMDVEPKQNLTDSANLDDSCDDTSFVKSKETDDTPPQSLNDSANLDDSREDTSFLESQEADDTNEKKSEKIERILAIWKDGRKVFVLELFHYLTEVEALNREACMIEAIGVGMLTNVKRERFQGRAVPWTMNQIRRLGVHILYKAFKLFTYTSHWEGVSKKLESVTDAIQLLRISK